MTIERILIPTRPQPDTIVAILLLQEYGTEKFPGVATAHVEIRNALSPEDTFDSLLEKGILALDVGGGLFDHHDTGKTASELVAKALGIAANPELKQLVAYAVRDDTQGKGTLSRDPLDRAFGLSGLIAALNKQYTDEPDHIVSLVLPLLRAHLHMTRQHTVELPKDILRKQESGDYVETSEVQGGVQRKIAFVTSEKPAMPGYLRAQSGRNIDVVVQKTEQGNHYAILSKQQKNVNLSKVMALIRLRESELMGIDLNLSEAELEQIRTIPQIPNWYYDPATNSLLNGGPHNRAIAESKIPWEEMLKIVPLGIRLG